jgi:hypothetical protein
VEGSGIVGRSPQFADAASASIAFTARNSRSAITARKLPSRTTFLTPGIFSTLAMSTPFDGRQSERRKPQKLL